jgi:hypothetical protein
MTEKELRRFEARYRRDVRVVLHYDELQSLTAEIRRCWAEIEELKKSQGYAPPRFEDECLSMAGNPEV